MKMKSFALQNNIYKTALSLIALIKCSQKDKDYPRSIKTLQKTNAMHSKVQTILKIICTPSKIPKIKTRKNTTICFLEYQIC